MWPDEVTKIMFLPDSNRILVVGKTDFYFFEVKTGALIKQIHTNREYNDVAVSSDGKFMFSLEGVKFDLESYQPIDTIKSFGSSIFNPNIASISADGLYVYYGGDVSGKQFPDSNFVEISTEDLKVKRILTIDKYVQVVITSPDNRYIVIGDLQTLQIYDRKTLSYIKTLFGDPPTHINYTRFNRDGSVLGVGTNDSVYIFDMKKIELLGNFNFNQCVNSFDFFTEKNIILVGYSYLAEYIGHFWIINASDLKNIFPLFHFLYRAGGFLNISSNERFILSYGYPASIFLFNNPLLTSVQEKDTHEELLYPNPTTGRVTIKSTFPIERIVLSNQTGLIVKEINNSLIIQGNGFISFSVSELPVGTYLCTVQGYGDSKTYKLIVMK